MRGFTAFGIVAVSSLAMGQIWTELGDAPAGVPAFQDTVGAGALSFIDGSINRGTGDHTDTYRIRITSQTLFHATTKVDLGGWAVSNTNSNLDTRLWLWDDQGNVLLGNDDINTFGSDNLASLISDPTTFAAKSGGEVVNATATGVVLNPGVYLLSISLFSNDPDDSSGEELVNLGADFDALHGRDPAAGQFFQWEDPASTTVGTYRIALDGAGYATPVPEPATLALIAGALGLAARRRRRA